MMPILALSIITLALGYIVGRYSVSRKLNAATNHNVALRVKLADCTRQRNLYFNAVKRTNEWFDGCQWDTKLSNVEVSELNHRMHVAVYDAMREAP